MIAFAADITVSSGGSVLWTPANLGASLLGWFDGADAASVTITGSGVSAWANKGASPFTLTQGTDNLRPSYAANAVTFADNSSQYLAAGSPPLAYDLLIVAKPNSYNDWRTLFLSVSGTTTENTILIQNTGQLGIYQATLNQAGGLTWANNTSGLCYAQISNAGPVLMSRDGGALASTGVAQLGIPLQGVGSSGSFDVHSYTQGFGAVYELTFVPYNSSLDTRQRLEGYAAWKWGLQALLPSGHPYKSAAPTVGTGSQYGKLAYGKGMYSRAAAPPTDLTGDLSLSIIFAGALVEIESLVGDLAPAVGFGAALTVIPAPIDLAGDFFPAIVFAADLTVTAATALAGDLAPSLTFAGALTSIVGLAGDFPPSVSFTGDLSLVGAPPMVDLTGGFAPSLSFAADLTITAPTQLAGDFAPVVAFVANLGIIEPVVGDLAPQITFNADLMIGIGDWLAGDLALSVTFAADMSVIFAGQTDLAGDLAPQVVFAGDFVVGSTVDLAGDMAPRVVFDADLTFLVDLVGDLVPQIDLEGLLGFDWPVDGDLPFQIDFAASEFISGPLWGEADPCPVPPWAATDPCPPPIWTPAEPPLSAWAPAELCGFPPATSSYGKGAYGLNQYSAASGWQETGSTPVDWKKTELCDG